MAVLACGGQPPPARSGADTDALLAAPRGEVPKASTHVADAEKRIAAGDAAGARGLLEQAIAADASDARAHLDLGIVCEMERQPGCAEANYQRAIELQGDLAEALNNLGVLLRDSGRLDEALGWLKRAAEANTESADAQMNLALALEDAGDAAAARGAYERALRLEPDAVMTRANYGLLLLGLGERETATAELQKALRGASGNRAALLAIGNGLRRGGEADLALQAMRAAVESGDTGGGPGAPLLAELALAERAAGDRDAAIATLERALSVDAGFATGHYLLGNMQAGARRFDRAAQHYERYLKLAPEGPHAARARDRLAKVRELRK